MTAFIIGGFVATGWRPDCRDQWPQYAEHDACGSNRVDSEWKLFDTTADQAYADYTTVWIAVECLAST